MNTSNCRYMYGSARKVLAVAAAVVLLAAPYAGAVVQDTATATGGSATVNAQWRSYDLNFRYMGFTTYYSCSGLEDRLKSILIELGADRDVKVTATGCFGPSDFNNMLSARIKVRMPVTEGGEAASFPAVVKDVTLRGDSVHMGSGDCELLEQVRDQLLPGLELSLVKASLACVPGHVATSRPILQVKALVAETKDKQ